MGKLNMNDLMKQFEPQRTECAGTGKGTDFDDTQDDINENEEEISGIEIRTGEIMDAIGVIYGENGKAALHGNPKGGTSYRIMFDQGDKLQSIQGICDVDYADNKCFSKVEIRTEKGKVYGPFGSSANGKKFQLKMPSGKRFLGLYGKVDEKAKVVSVNCLGLIYSDEGMNMPDISGDELSGMLRGLL